MSLPFEATQQPGGRPSEAARPTGHPTAGKAKPRGGSAIYNFAQVIENVFSHRGLFVLGVVVTLVCFYANASFWVNVFASVGYAGAIALFLGVLASFGTSIFQVLPVVYQHSRRLSLMRLFSAGIKPDRLPAINDKVVPDAERMLTQYKESDRARRKFFSLMRWVAYGVETLMGVIFLGSVGTGFVGIVQLLMFVVSIVGVEWGVSLALRASQDELPPNVQQQFDSLIEKSNQQLSLKEIR
jgi:hypothetical protein